MGLAERLSEWLLRRRERQEERNMRQVTAYFGSLLKKRRADAGAILQSVRDYRDCPEVTRKQAELLEHRFFRYVYQTGYPEWRAVMDALKETRYGMRERAAIPRSVKEAAESPMLRLAAQYKVLEHEYTRRNAPQPLSPEAQAERDAAHRLLNCCMREGDLDALKRLALKGEKPDDSVAIRHGLAEGYRRLEELSREWSEEMRGDNHTVMEQIELREADERGKLMRQAAALYERKTGGILPGDYLEAVKAERALLHGLARHGWDGQREVPKETVEKYGLMEDFAGIARLRWDYHLSEDNGDLSRDYPEAAIGRHNRAIRERAAKELAGLEARLFPEKAASRERKAAHLRADNRASPTASLKRERKEPPGKRQAGETGRRKPPGRRIRM
ncbi:hypothetical protein [Phocaeicola vulgatus]|uniref:hypothetical protein n=1 Tax=Phocaeicola vulgatus TaxID=821 RepID=UPI0022E824FF|nr:hypothetical protein [Phocaeicola vulgatus]